MNLVVRIILVVALVASIVGASLWIGGDAKGAGDNGEHSASTASSGAGSSTLANGSAAPKVWTSSRECKACHEDVWNEWYGSHHQISYLNPEVRKLSDDFRNKECQACHLPVPVSQTGYAKRTLPRQTLLDEGVSCLSCHLGKNGEILGARTLEAAPCAPVASTEMASVDMCASCHNQHQTTDQWRASPQAAQAVTCNTCHMPEVTRKLAGGGTKTGRGHAFLGAHDKATLRAAGKFTFARDGDDKVALTLENVGAGHNFPTEERHRAVDMLYRFVMDDESVGEWVRAYRFRQPYRDEKGPNTQLPAGESKTVAVEIPEGAVRAEARLWYRLTPYIGDEDPKCTLLEERSLDLR